MNNKISIATLNTSAAAFDRTIKSLDLNGDDKVKAAERREATASSPAETRALASKLGSGSVSGLQAKLDGARQKLMAADRNDDGFIETSEVYTRSGNVRRDVGTVAARLFELGSVSTLPTEPQNPGDLWAPQEFAKTGNEALLNDVRNFVSFSDSSLAAQDATDLAKRLGWVFGGSRDPERVTTAAGYTRGDRVEVTADGGPVRGLVVSVDMGGVAAVLTGAPVNETSQQMKGLWLTRLPDTARVSVLNTSPSALLGSPSSVPGLNLSAAKFQTNSSGAYIDLKVSRDDGAIKYKYPYFDGLTDVEVGNNTLGWMRAMPSGDDSFSTGATTPILLAQNLQVGVRARVQVGENRYETVQLIDNLKVD